MNFKKPGFIAAAVVTLAGLLTGCGSQGGTSTNGTPGDSAKQVDISSLKTPSGQPLVQVQLPPTPPQRPSNPNALPETNILHWWDQEYAWDVPDKVNIPKSPGNGPQGKTVIMIEPGPHPYFTAYSNGAKEVAKAYGINLKTMVGDWSVNTQQQEVQQAINMHPDLIILAPLGATVATPEMRDINDAGIPVIASNLLPTTEGMKYALTWTGPDDWAQMKLLADTLAKDMNYQGDYVLVRHNPGASPYYSRTWGIIDELLKVAPKMKVLAYQTADLDATKTQNLVSGWLSQYGNQIKGISLSDDSGSFVGTEKAVQNANRTDITIVAAGNSKIGMDGVKSGQMAAINYQSAMGDGALPVYEAAQWFSGKTLPLAAFLPQQILTKDNVSQYYPPQW